MWIRAALVLALGFALAQTTYDELLVQDVDLTTVLGAIAATKDNAFVLLPNLDATATIEALVRLASSKTVYLIIPEASRGNYARNLLASGVKIKTIPGEIPAGVIVIDYQSVISGDLTGQGDARIIRSGSDELLVVNQLRAAWQAATPYEAP